MAYVTHKVVTKMDMYVSSGIRNNPATVYAKQKDKNSRFVQGTLFSRPHSKLSVPQDARVILFAGLPDGTTQTSIGGVNSDGTIMVELNQFVLSKVGAVSCDLSIVYEEAGYTKVEEGDTGALKVVANTAIPVGDEIRIGDTYVFGIAVGDYVALSTRDVKITANRFYIQVEDNHYTEADIIQYREEDGYIYEGDDVYINYTLQDKTDVTFTNANVQGVTIQVPDVALSHGFMCGVNIKNGATPPTFNFVNNAAGEPNNIQLKLVYLQQVIGHNEYQPAPNSETIMAFFYTGNKILYGYISEV